MGTGQTQPGGSGRKPFDEIVDDSGPRNECLEWVIEELRKDRMPDDIEADLVATGWTARDAASVVEEAKLLTARRTPTRQSVAKAYGAGDSSVNRGTLVSNSYGMNAGYGLFHGIFRLWSTKDAARPVRPAPSNGAYRIVSWISILCFLPIGFAIAATWIKQDPAYLKSGGAFACLSFPGLVLGLVGAIGMRWRSPIAWIGLLLNAALLLLMGILMVLP